MKPLDRYEVERQQNREMRMEQILDAAKVLFMKKGIEKTTMQDIATEANLGVATVFRIFSKKERIAVIVATRRLEVISVTFKKIAMQNKTALRKIENILDRFTKDLENDSNIRMLEEFDMYSTRLEGPIEGIEEFQKVYKEVSLAFASIIAEGKKDGSIRANIDIEATLITLINAFGTFARKLAITKSIFFIELDLEPEKQLEQFRSIILDYLSAE